MRGSRIALIAICVLVASGLWMQRAHEQRQSAALREAQKQLAAAQDALTISQKELQGLRARRTAKKDEKAAPSQSAEHVPYEWEHKITSADTSNNVFVVSMGTDDGVKVGDDLVISRGDSYVSTLRIKSARAEESTGALVRGMSKSEPRVGDGVFPSR